MKKPAQTLMDMGAQGIKGFSLTPTLKDVHISRELAGD